MLTNIQRLIDQPSLPRISNEPFMHETHCLKRSNGGRWIAHVGMQAMPMQTDKYILA